MKVQVSTTVGRRGPPRDGGVVRTRVVDASFFTRRVLTRKCGETKAPSRCIPPSLHPPVAHPGSLRREGGTGYIRRPLMARYQSMARGRAREDGEGCDDGAHFRMSSSTSKQGSIRESKGSMHETAESMSAPQTSSNPKDATRCGETRYSTVELIWPHTVIIIHVQ